MGSLDCSAEIKLEIKMGNNSHHPGEVLWWCGPAGQGVRSSDSGSSEAETREFANGLDVRHGRTRSQGRLHRCWGLSHWKGGLAGQNTGEDHTGAGPGKSRGSVSDASGLRHLPKHRHPGCACHGAMRWPRRRWELREVRWHMAFKTKKLYDITHSVRREGDRKNKGVKDWSRKVPM